MRHCSIRGFLHLTRAHTHFCCVVMLPKIYATLLVYGPCVVLSLDLINTFSLNRNTPTHKVINEAKILQFYSNKKNW